MSNDQTAIDEANQKREEWADLLALAVLNQDWHEVKTVLFEMKAVEFSE
jgi:hypothetical protein